MQSHNQRRSELFLDRKSRASIDGKVCVDQHRLKTSQFLMESWRVSRGEIEPAQKFVHHTGVFRCDLNARGFESYAVGHAPKSGKPGIVSTQCACLRHDEGFGRGEELVSIDENASHVR